MNYRIDAKYVWYENGSRIVRMYFIQNLPFTFDDLNEGELYDKSIIEEANQEKSWELEELYDISGYLVSEECHPLLYNLELENPELMPTD